MSPQLYAKEGGLEIEAQGKAVEKCADLTNKSVTDLGVSAQYQGLSLQQWRKIVGSMCLNGITAARDAKSKDDLDTYWLGLKQNYIDAQAGVLSTPLDAAWSISQDYFFSIHGIKAKEDTDYPELPENPTSEEKIAAIEKYSSQKMLRGIPIKAHCEKISESMPNKSAPPPELKKVALQICEGVMTMNFTKNKHGLSGEKALEITKKSYNPNSIEYKYIKQVINISYSESSS